MTHESEALDHEHEALSQEAETLYDDDNLSEPERYDTADGWEPEYQHQKLLDDYRKNNSEYFCRQSMLATKPAAEWQRTVAANNPQQNLFGNLWRTGELAVLFGESGVGKSILAIQIAESIARGRSMETGDQRQENGSKHALVSRLPSLVSPAQPVLYLDFDHTAAQFTERYSCPSPIPGKLPLKYRFSPKLSFTRFEDLDIPAAFNGDLARYFEHSLNLTLGAPDAKVIVIDNLSWLDPKSSGPAAAIRRMRSLKLYCLTTGASILVLDSVSSQRVSSPHVSKGSTRPPLNIPRTAHRIYDIADTIFAIGRSVTFGEDIRYVKPLKSNYVTPKAETRPVGSVSLVTPHSALRTPHSDEVHVYRLERSPGPQPSRLQTLLSRLPSPVPADPFLGFTYLGPAPESELLRDHEREHLDAEAREKAQLAKLRRRSSKEILVDAMMDGSYGRYLKGD